jgi:hypothetical protein
MKVLEESMLSKIALGLTVVAASVIMQIIVPILER